MIARTLKASLLAGFLAACVAAALQLLLTTPLILQAETYEKSALSGANGAVRGGLQPAHEHNASPQAAEEEEWEPSEGLSRAAFTALATLVSGIGYALILTALILAAGRGVGMKAAVQWAIGGFLAVNLAPSVGLPPELPGMGGENLALRQVWWVCTALSTGLGLYLLTVVRTWAAVMLGLLALGFPHLIGAPHLVVTGSEVPAALAAQFSARSLAVAFAFWVSLGAALSWCWAQAEDQAQHTMAAG